MNEERRDENWKWGCKEETFLELAKLSQQSFQNRQSYEWKIAFALWTAIGIFTYFAVEHPGAISGSGPLVLGIPYLILFGVWCFLWKPALHNASNKDKDWMLYFTHRAENRPPSDSAPDPRRENKKTFRERVGEHFGVLKTVWPWVQSIPTLVFLIVSFAIIQGHPEAAPIPGKHDTIYVSGDNVTKVIDKLTR
jgi:hypothetical protein